MARLENRPTQAEGTHDVPASNIDSNPNIGALGSAAYQEDSRRVKGFCGEVIDDAATYLRHLSTKVLPVVYQNERTTRIIDRAIVRRDIVLPTTELAIPLYEESRIELGGEWEGYDWVMIGTHMPGRILSQPTRDALVRLAEEAAAFDYERPKPLPEGFTMERLGKELPPSDLQALADIFSAAFTDYISPLSTPEDVHAWVTGDNIMPVVVRNERGEIVAISNGDMGEINLDGKVFKFFEIGDSAAHVDYRKMGLNRSIKHYIISQAAKMGFHSIHSETRAAWKSPNVGNAKNGMEYRRTLFLNCLITGEEDVEETKDPDINEDSRRMGSLNVWSITERSPLWQMYVQEA